MKTGTSRKVALLGGTGAVGGHFLNKALAAGHEVRALVRTPSKLVDQPGLTALKGDAANLDDVAQLVAGSDAVVSCVGNPKGHQIMERTAGAVLSAAAAQATPPKCLFISSIGCGGSSWLIKQVLTMIGGKAGFTDYDRADARIVRETVVPCVLVRPAALKEKPGNGKYRVFRGDGTFARPIEKEDVAQFLLDALATDKWIGQGGVQLAGRR